MNLNRKLAGIGLLVAGSTAGYLLVNWVPQLAAEYQRAAEFHPYWGYLYLAVVILVGANLSLLTGYLAWILVRNSRRKRARRQAQSRNPSQMTLKEREVEVQSRLAEGQTFADDTALPEELRRPIQQSLAELRGKLESRSLEIVAFGTVSSGKSSVLNALVGREVFRTDAKGGTTVARNEVPWPNADRVVLVDTPGLAEIDGQERIAEARRAARDADLVLFVIDGPLKDFEFLLLQQLAEMEKRVLVCLNKEDWFRPEDRTRLAGQVADQVTRLIPAEDIVTLQAQPATRTRVRVLADGGEVEETVEVEPDLQQLAERMMSIVEQDGRDLLLANLLLQSRGLVAESKRQIQGALDKRAQQIVDRTMWQAGTIAALSPLPVIDVAASLALSTKMVVDLARVYRQNIDLEAAGRLVGELGKNLVSILGASLAGPAIGTAVASVFKTVPGVGTIAGGVLQGLVQALVTRWIGQVFIVYFRSEMKEPEAGWAALARAKWSEVTRPAELAQLVQKGIARLGGRKQ